MFLMWDFILLLVLLVSFSNKSGFWGSQDVQHLLSCWCPCRSWSCWRRCMQSKVGNVFPLFTNIRKCAGLLFVLGILNNVTLVKVKEACLTEWTLHLINLYLSHSKKLMWRWKLVFCRNKPAIWVNCLKQI